MSVYPRTIFSTYSKNKALAKSIRAILLRKMTSKMQFSIFSSLEIFHSIKQTVRTSKDPKLTPPPEFSGKISKYRNFIAQCTLTFTMCDNTYNNDEKKVLFVISCLRGTALSWAREIAESENHPLRTDYLAFKTAMSDIYLDQNYRELCETKLNALRQTKSAAAYSVEFATLSAPLSLNDEALCLNFYRGLHDDVKDRMAIVGS